MFRIPPTPLPKTQPQTQSQTSQAAAAAAKWWVKWWVWPIDYVKNGEVPANIELAMAPARGAISAKRCERSAPQSPRQMKLGQSAVRHPIMPIGRP